uniref:Uncharacterized protein n=1 Tax=viral metagenome TaxID=1070528 RepID=A0A6C0EIZ6_9ZZZZ
MENADFLKFKENVKNYISFDDDIKKIEKVLKEKKTDKKAITESIIEFMSTYNIEDLSTENGKLKKSVSFTKKALNKNTLQQKLTQYFNNEAKGAEATLFILNNRDKDKRIRLKRIDKKI